MKMGKESSETEKRKKERKKKGIPCQGVEPCATANYLCEHMRGGNVTDTPAWSTMVT
jgi:hypothetical protein